DGAGVGEHPEDDAARGGEHGPEQEDAVGVPPPDGTDPVEEQQPEGHPGEVVDHHGQHLGPEAAPVGPGFGQRTPHGGNQRGPASHRPTTWSRRSPAANTTTATMASTTSQPSWATGSIGSTWPDASRAGA